jgi:hypothetical protein
MEEMSRECEESSSLVSKLRAENSDLIRASREAIETREQFRKTTFELERCRNEMKHVDEEMALLQVQRGREADKLIAMVRSPLLSPSQPAP